MSERVVSRRMLTTGVGALVLAAAAPVAPGRIDAEAFETFRNHMIGQWSGEGEMDGARYADRYRFELGAMGRFVRAEYTMLAPDGAVMWHDFGAYGLDPRTGRFFTHGFGSDGATANSVLRSYEAGTWRFAGRTHGSTTFTRYRFQLHLIEAEEVEATTEAVRASRWETIFQSRYRRHS